MLVEILGNSIEQAIKFLRKRMQREGIFREMKVRMYHEKPSVKKARRASEAVRRHRKLERKRRQRENQ